VGWVRRPFRSTKKKTRARAWKDPPKEKRKNEVSFKRGGGCELYSASRKKRGGHRKPSRMKRKVISTGGEKREERALSYSKRGQMGSTSFPRKKKEGKKKKRSNLLTSSVVPFWRGVRITPDRAACAQTWEKNATTQRLGGGRGRTSDVLGKNQNRAEQKKSFVLPAKGSKRERDLAMLTSIMCKKKKRK